MHNHNNTYKTYVEVMYGVISKYDNNTRYNKIICRNTKVICFMLTWYYYSY